MAELRCSRKHNKNDIWLPNSFFKNTPTSKSRLINTFSNSNELIDVRTDRDFETTKNLDSNRSISKLCLSDVFSTKVRYQQSPDIQFKKSKSLCNANKVSSNKYVPCAGFLATERLGDQNRPFPGLFSSSDRLQSLPISASIIRNRKEVEPGAPSDHLFAIRAVIGTQGICDSDELGSRRAAREGHASNRLFGRLFDREPRSINPDGPCCGSYKGPNNFGVDDQLPKIHINPYQSRRLPRHKMESRPEFQIFARGKGWQNLQYDTPHTTGKSMEFARCSMLARHAKLCSLRCTQRSASLPPITSSLQSASKAPSIRKTPTRVGSVDDLNVVVTSSINRNSDTSRSCLTLCNDRRICQRLGCHSRRRFSERIMVPGTEEMAQQFKGNVGSYTSLNQSSAIATSFNRASPIRQQECGELHAERGGSPITEPLSANVHVIRDCGREQDSPGLSVPARSGKHRRGHAVKAQITRGVDLNGRSMSRGISQVRNARNRLVRLENRARACSLRLTRLQRLERRVSRRLQQKVVIPSSMGIPATTHNSTNSVTPQPVQGSLHPNSTALVQNVLAAGPEEESGERSITHIQSSASVTRYTDISASGSRGPDVSRGMASEGWCAELTNWSQNEIDLLNSSWRSSTKKMYAAIWKKWLKWCTDNNFNHTNPSGAQVAKYLAYLHLTLKLSYKTILVYKSTIVTLACPNGRIISSDPIVQRMLKAISLANVDSKPRNSFIWDPRIVVEWLSCNQPPHASLFQVSRRTALILLLASSRRVHDLTLLRVDSAHFEDNSNHIILHPAFGSKTDSYTHRQSSWKLHTHTDKSICPVWWIRKLIETSSSRRINNDINHLFISTRGRVRPASRTVIGGWVKTILKEAGIEATPGRTRSAAASLNWLECHNIDEIMAKGNWRVPNTFARFYSAEINASQSCNNLSLTFEAV